MLRQEDRVILFHMIHEHVAGHRQIVCRRGEDGDLIEKFGHLFLTETAEVGLDRFLILGEAAEPVAATLSI